MSSSNGNNKKTFLWVEMHLTFYNIYPAEVRAVLHECILHSIQSLAPFKYVHHRIERRRLKLNFANIRCNIYFHVS